MPTLNHVTLLTGKRGYGYDCHKNRWYISYLDHKKLCREFLPAGAGEEEALAERERRYMELALLGAMTQKQRSAAEAKAKQDAIARKAAKQAEKEARGIAKRMEAEAYAVSKLRKDVGIYAVKVCKTHYKVWVSTNYIGTFHSILDAREARDKAKKQEHSLRPCAHCGQRPEHTRDDKYKWTIYHECPGNYLRHRDTSRTKNERNWNFRQYKGPSKTKTKS
jgi:hypothetical protein